LLTGTQALVNRTQARVYRTQALVNRTQALVNRTQALVNRTQALVNRTRALVNRTQAFGVDPVFNRGGSLYDAGARSRMGEYYNVTAGSDVFNALGNPQGFSPASACVTGDDSTFVAVIDAGVTAARADQLARLLLEGGFLHRHLYSLQLKVLTWNADEDKWAVRTLFAHKRRGGR
jgi:hypothetical protein